MTDYKSCSQKLYTYEFDMNHITRVKFQKHVEHVWTYKTCLVERFASVGNGLEMSLPFLNVYFEFFLIQPITYL